VLVARGASGETAIYDPVSLAFNSKENILETVIAPAQVMQTVSDEAVRIAQRVVEKLQGVGLFAVELFLTNDGQVLINEISPRVHNAGHHTLEACETSQFEQHLRAIAGLPLGSVALRRPAVMRNLLYTPDLKPLCAWGPKTVAGGDEDTFVHWYGKRDPRPYRKMGHITAMGDTAQKALELAEEVRDRLPALATCGTTA
jgi:5-(carboxyamino)imidazole ribonucleotide synthase